MKKIVITAIGNGRQHMKRCGATAFALALFLSLGVLAGCGWAGRTVPSGYYGYPKEGELKVRPTDPSGMVRHDLPYWTVEADGTWVRTEPSGAQPARPARQKGHG